MFRGRFDATIIVFLWGIFTPGGVSGACPKKFHDVASQTVLSPVVVLGRAESRKGSASNSFSYEVVFSVTMGFKGDLDQEPEVKGDRRLIVVGPFGDASSSSSSLDQDRCFGGSIEVGNQVVLFLRRSMELRTDPKHETSLSYFELFARPRSPSQNTIELIRKHSCHECSVPPSVQLLPAGSIEVNSNERIELNCLIRRGKPFPVITWFKNGIHLENSSHIHQLNNRSSWRLVIEKVSLEDSGVYKCQGRNVLGQSESSTVQLMVIPSPAIAAVLSPLSSSLSSSSSAIPQMHKPHAVVCDESSYCLNGGSCFVLQALGIRFCLCPEELQGARCQEKRVTVLETRKQMLEESFPKDFFVAIILGGFAGLFTLIAIIIVLCFLHRSLVTRKKVSKSASNRIMYSRIDVPSGAQGTLELETKDNSLRRPEVKKDACSVEVQTEAEVSEGGRPFNSWQRPHPRHHHVDMNSVNGNAGFLEQGFDSESQHTSGSSSSFMKLKKPSYVNNEANDPLRSSTSSLKDLSGMTSQRQSEHSTEDELLNGRRRDSDPAHNWKSLQRNSLTVELYDSDPDATVV